MIRGGFLDPESRKDLIELARDGSAAHRLGRRANAVLLLDDGMTCEATARVLFVDDDTVRTCTRTISGFIEGQAARKRAAAALGESHGGLPCTGLPSAFRRLD
jgi:hypothetical protein